MSDLVGSQIVGFLTHRLILNVSDTSEPYDNKHRPYRIAVPDDEPGFVWSDSQVTQGTTVIVRQEVLEQVGVRVRHADLGTALATYVDTG